MRLHGENGLTFALFKDLEESGLYSEFSRECMHGSEGRLLPEAKQPEMHLFPSFGRRKGFGEPDAAVTTGDYVALFEVKTESFRKATYHVSMADRGDFSSPKGITYEVRRFTSLINAIGRHKREPIEVGKRIAGPILLGGISSPKIFEVSVANRDLVAELAKTQKRLVVCVSMEKGAGFPPLLHSLIGALQSVMDDTDRVEYAWIDLTTVRDFAESKDLRHTIETLDLNEIS